MLLTTITFDETSQLWENDQSYNIMMLNTVERNLNDLIGHRGYIYLNQIYEYLGIKWDVKDENPCLTNDSGKVYIKFELKSSNNAIIINIHYYD